MKLSKKQINQIRKLRKKGLKLREIAKKFNVAESTLQYHINETYRKSVKEKARERMRKLTKKERYEKNKKSYNPGYYKNKYNNDPKFRKKIIKITQRCQRKLYKKRKEKGLCVRCGNKAIEKNKSGKKYLNCEKCREKYKKRRRREKRRKNNETNIK